MIPFILSDSDHAAPRTAIHANVPGSERDGFRPDSKPRFSRPLLAPDSTTEQPGLPHQDRGSSIPRSETFGDFGVPEQQISRLHRPVCILQQQYGRGVSIKHFPLNFMTSPNL